MKRAFLVAVAGCVVALACSNSVPVPTGPFTLTLEIDGAGSVTSDPVGFTCTGGAPCPAQTFDLGTVVYFTAAPAPNNHVDRWFVDDVDDGLVAPVVGGAGAGSTHPVKVVFVANDVPDADTSDASDAGVEAEAEAAAPVSCGATTCMAGEHCCADAADTLSCASTCTAEATCFGPTDCATGGACCWNQTTGATTCAASSTTCGGSIACSAIADCPGTTPAATDCTPHGGIKVCVYPP